MNRVAGRVEQIEEVVPLDEIQDGFPVLRAQPLVSASWHDSREVSRGPSEIGIVHITGLAARVSTGDELPGSEHLCACPGPCAGIPSGTEPPPLMWVDFQR